MNTRIGLGLRGVGVIVFGLGLAWASVMPGDAPLAGILGGHCNTNCQSSSLQPCSGGGCLGQQYCECNGDTYANCTSGTNWCATKLNCGIPAGHPGDCYCPIGNYCGQWS